MNAYLSILFMKNFIGVLKKIPASLKDLPNEQRLKTMKLVSMTMVI